MVGRQLVGVERSNGPDDGLRRVGRDRLVLVVAGLQRPLVGQHDVVVDQRRVQQPDVVTAFLLLLSVNMQHYNMFMS